MIHNRYCPEDEDDWFPCTLEYFYKNNKSPDGLYPYCKRCNSLKSYENLLTHMDKHIERVKANNRTEKYIEIQREVARKRIRNGKFKKWQQENKERVNEYSRRRSKEKKHKISKKQWKLCKEYFNNECAYCGMNEIDSIQKYKNKLHKDHVDHEGSNELNNCIPACKQCNSEKHTRTLDFWYNDRNPKYTYERLNKIHKWINEDYKIALN